MTSDRSGDHKPVTASRSRRTERPPTASEQLEELLAYPWPFPGRPPKHDLSTWTVTDDWPDPVPVTEAEIEVFERWFGDVFDELFGLDTGSSDAGAKSALKTVLKNDTGYSMKKRHRATLELIFARPVNGSVRWADIEVLFVALGAEVSEREGSRVGVFLFGEVRVFHRPHPSPDTDKGAVASIRKWLDEHGVKP